MTSILGGKAARQILHTPKHRKTRPTQARVREAIFSMLEARLGSLEGCRVLDGFAGSGALGLEAWSRGASEIWLIEAHGPTCRIISANAQRLGASRECKIIKGQFPQIIERLKMPEWDLIFLDPPYGKGFLEPTMRQLMPYLKVQGYLIVEHPALLSWEWPPEWKVVQSKKYGGTGVSLFQKDPHF